MRKYYISKKELQALHYEKGLTQKAISDLKNIPRTTLFYIFKRYGLKTRKWNRAWNSGKTCFNDSRILSGEKHPRWQDKSKYYIRYKLLVKTMRENKTKCNKCDNLAVLLHHKNKNTEDNGLKNLEPICRSCHSILHNKERGITIYNHNCEQCGKKFTVYHNKKCAQRFCSLTCKSTWAYRHGQSLKHNPR